MEAIFEFLKGFDLQQIISIFAIVYFLTNHRFKGIENKLTELSGRVESLDRALIRLDARFEERGRCEKHHIDPTKSAAGE